MLAPSAAFDAALVNGIAAQAAGRSSHRELYGDPANPDAQGVKGLRRNFATPVFTRKQAQVVNHAGTQSWPIGHRKGRSASRSLYRRRNAALRMAASHERRQAARDIKLNPSLFSTLLL